MHTDLEGLTAALLDAARKAGADSADALAVAGTSVSIDVRMGKLEQAERSEGIDIGLRVLLGQRQACVSASDISAGTIAAMAERAVAMAREAPQDPTCGLADPAQLAKDWDVAALDLADPSAEPTPAALQEAALQAEAAALRHKGISRSTVPARAIPSDRCFWLPAMGSRGVMAAQGMACLAWPSPAMAPGWSATISVTAASITAI